MWEEEGDLPVECPNAMQACVLDDLDHGSDERVAVRPPQGAHAGSLQHLIHDELFLDRLRCSVRIGACRRIYRRARVKLPEVRKE